MQIMSKKKAVKGFLPSQTFVHWIRHKCRIDGSPPTIVRTGALTWGVTTGGGELDVAQGPPVPFPHMMGPALWMTWESW